MRKHYQALTTITLSIVLTACGGGDGATDNQKSSTEYSTAQKIENRQSIPVFYPWSEEMHGKGGMTACNPNIWSDCDTSTTPYSLVWAGNGSARNIENTQNTVSSELESRMKNDPNTLHLISEEWHYYYPKWRDLAATSKFYTGVNFEPHNGSEYNQTLMINFTHADWADLLAEKSLNYKRSGYNGIMFDWWHDLADGIGDGAPNDFRTNEEIKQARINIARAIREKAGDDFIVLGNVNDRVSDEVAPYMSGVFMELMKSPEHTYTYNEIGNIMSSVVSWNNALAEPKIIAFNPWKVTPNGVGYIDARLQAPNPQYAQLFAAMVMAIVDNGYIMYGDNNADWTGGDHQHAYYDFYRTDIGKPVGNLVVIEPSSATVPNAGYKEYEKGYAVYNRSDVTTYTVVLDEVQYTIQPMTGRFINK